MSPKRKISIIIPAKNEARLLASTLGQFEVLKSSYDLEIIVSDGGSVDDTCRVATKHGAIIVHKTKDPQTIGEGRNDGAKVASGEIFFFFDADTLMKDPEKFFGDMISTFDNYNVVAAIPKLKVFPDQRNALDRIFHFFYNNTIRTFIAIKQPMSGGQCQVVRASAFREIGGYPQGVAHAEDAAMLKRIKNVGRVVFKKNLIILESPRRYRNWGYWKLIRVATKSFFFKTIFKKEVLTEWERVD